VILALAAIAGAQLLNVFGISLSAFRVAGGAVLVWMGFLMLRGNSGPTSSPGTTEPNTPSSDSSAITPLILFAASPGTITGVITLSVSHSGHNLPVTALVAVAVAMTLTWIMMLVSTQKSSDKKPGFVHDVSTRFMGLIVLAMGVQFALSGLQQFFSNVKA
jgi:multiple antibiotic resistance protein